MDESPMREAPVQRRLAAILAADVAGYSRLMGMDEVGTLAALKAVRCEVMDPAIAAHGGRIVKTTGDGLLAEFPSVVEAVECAVRIQREMTARNEGTPADRAIALRIGINVGDVIIEDEDVYGDGVNIAARLEQKAETGGICVSRAVYDQVRDKLPVAFRDGGEQAVKNISRRLRMWHVVLDKAPQPQARHNARFPPGRRRRLAWGFAALCAAALLAGLIGRPLLRSAAADLPPSLGVPRLSIAVMPFANLSGDRDQDYFADALTEDLTTDLSRISGSFVISRGTAATYKGQNIDAMR